MANVMTPVPPPATERADGTLQGTVAEALVVVVAPSTGRFRPLAEITEGDETAVDPGTLLGHVTGGRGRADEVRAPAAGAVRRLLARPGQVVRRGQPLAWLERAEAAA